MMNCLFVLLETLSLMMLLGNNERALSILEFGLGHPPLPFASEFQIPGIVLCLLGRDKVH